MKFEKLLTYYANLEPGLDIGNTPNGNRIIVEVNGGEFEGDRLKGKIRNLSAADWAIVHDGYFNLDVRATLETHDGALIYLQYFGILEVNEAVGAALGGEGTTDYGDQYFFTNPRLHTGDERYAWVNKIFCVGQGRLLAGKVEYNVYQVLND